MADYDDDNDYEEEFQEADEPDNLDDDLEQANEQEQIDILPADEADKKNSEKITTPYMTKYERARVLGTRALQIGKKCVLKNTAGQKIKKKSRKKLMKSNKSKFFFVKLHFWQFSQFKNWFLPFWPFLKLQKMEFGQKNYS